MFSDFRVICATNKDLEQMTREHQFRNDLLYRLQSFILKIPPLRKRKDDILQIAVSQMKACCDQYHTNLKEMTPDFIDTLENIPGLEM